MLTRRCDFQHPAGCLLTFQVRHVGRLMRCGKKLRPRRREHLTTAKMVEERHQVRRRDNAQVTRPGGLGPACLRADQVHARANRRHRCRQHARHRLDPAMQRQLAKDKRPVHGIGRHRSDGDQQAERDGKVVMRAFLHHIGRRQIDRDPLGRERQPDRGQCRTDPFTRLGDSLVGKSDNGHRRKTVGDMDLHLDRNGVDAAKGHRLDAGMHLRNPVLLDHP